jgi:hypothetical protein
VRARKKKKYMVERVRYLYRSSAIVAWHEGMAQQAHRCPALPHRRFSHFQAGEEGVGATQRTRHVYRWQRRAQEGMEEYMYKAENRYKNAPARERQRRQETGRVNNRRAATRYRKAQTTTAGHAREERGTGRAVVQEQKANSRRRIHNGKSGQRKKKAPCIVKGGEQSTEKVRVNAAEV